MVNGEGFPMQPDLLCVCDCQSVCKGIGKGSFAIIALIVEWLSGGFEHQKDVV